MSKMDRIMVGGLMKCCVKTIQERPGLAKEGDTLTCTGNNKKCNGANMKFENGAWHWQPK